MSLFLLHLHRQTCRSCGKQETLSLLYRPEVQGAATRLTPERSPLPPDAIVQVTTIPEVSIPVCWECVDTSEAAQARAREASERWAETIRRKRGEALLPSETSRFATSKGKASYAPKPIEDLA